MEVLRVNGSTPSINFSGLTASAGYSIAYSDLLTGEEFEAMAIANTAGTIEFLLNEKYGKYDGNLEMSVYDLSENLLITTNVDVTRPYVDISSLMNELGKTESEAKEIERFARYTIDSEVGGFGFVRKEKEIVGNGSDYLVVNENIVKLYRVYENGKLLFDSESNNNEVNFAISKDKTSIVPVETLINKTEYAEVWRDRYLGRAFADGYDYVIDADFGYKVIPQDIQEAAKVLSGDVSGDAGRYTNKYIQSFDNDDFKITFAKGFANGTGNLAVDKILAKYKNSIRAGVL